MGNQLPVTNIQPQSLNQLLVRNWGVETPEKGTFKGLLAAKS